MRLKQHTVPIKYNSNALGLLHQFSVIAKYSILKTITTRNAGNQLYPPSFVNCNSSWRYKISFVSSSKLTIWIGTPREQLTIIRQCKSVRIAAYNLWAEYIIHILLKYTSLLPFIGWGKFSLSSSSKCPQPKSTRHNLQTAINCQNVPRTWNYTNMQYDCTDN